MYHKQSVGRAKVVKSKDLRRTQFILLMNFMRKTPSIFNKNESGERDLISERNNIVHGSGLKWNDYIFLGRPSIVSLTLKGELKKKAFNE